MKLITDIYDAALDPSRWIQALDALAPIAGAQSAAVMSVETVKRFDYQLSAASSHFDPEPMRVYVAKYAEYEMAEFNRLTQARVGELVTAPMDGQPIEEFAQRPDVQYLRKHFGMLYRAGFRLTDDPARVDLLAIQYHESRGNITETEHKALVPLMPHVAQAMQLAKSFSVLQSRYKAALAVLDRFTIGMVLVRQSGQIVLANLAARKILEERNGLRESVLGRLEATDVTADRQLQQAMHKAAETASGEGRTPAATMRLARNSEAEPYVVDISPMRDPDNELQAGFAGTLVSIIDPDYGLSLDTRLLKSLFGLTTAEVDVAEKVLAGLSTIQIAEARSVSSETVKSQIGSIYTKTNADSRAQLVRRVLNVLLPIQLL